MKTKHPIKAWAITNYGNVFVDTISLTRKGAQNKFKKDWDRFKGTGVLKVEKVSIELEVKKP